MPQKEIVYSEEEMMMLETAGAAIDEGFDPDAEYNRPSPPIEDGWYFGKVSNAGIYKKGADAPSPFRTSKWKNEQVEHFEIAVKGEIVAPDKPLVDGKHVYTDMPLRSKVDPDRGNTSGIAAAFRALAGEPIKGVNEGSHAKQLVELLKTEPTGWFRVQNVLQDRDAEKAAYEAGAKGPKRVYGQKKIAALKGGSDSQGKFTGAADHPETGTRCVSRAFIQEFKPANWEGPTASK